MKNYILARIENLKEGFEKINVTFLEEDFMSSYEVIERVLELFVNHINLVIPKAGDKYLDSDKTWKVADKDLSEHKIILSKDLSEEEVHKLIPQRKEENKIRFLVHGTNKNIIKICDNAVKTYNQLKFINIVFIPSDKEKEDFVIRYMKKKHPNVKYSFEGKLYERSI